MTYKILVVDDEPSNIRLLERVFNRKYQVLCAYSGQEALELLKQHDVALIICDQRMPLMNGIEFLKRAAEMRPRVVRIVISGFAEVSVLTEAINSGVIYRFVSKPWNNEDLQQTVARALEHFEIIKRQHELERTNERLVKQMASMRRLIERLNVDLAEIDDDASFAIESARLTGEQNAGIEKFEADEHFTLTSENETTTVNAA